MALDEKTGLIISPVNLGYGGGRGSCRIVRSPPFAMIPDDGTY